MKLKHLVPASLRRWRFVLSQLARGERRALLAATIAARFGSRRQDWRVVMRHASSVVFVCHGNIIRSPLAAAALSRLAAARGISVRVTSAGLAARAGEPADPRAIDSADERGLSLAAHRARLLDAPEVAGLDAIFVMDFLNLGRLLARFPEAAPRTFLLGGCRPDGGMAFAEIHDPVSGTLTDVRVAHDQVIAATELLASAWDRPAA